MNASGEGWKLNWVSAFWTDNALSKQFLADVQRGVAGRALNFKLIHGKEMGFVATCSHGM